MAFNFSRTPFTNERLPRLVFILAIVAVVGLTLWHGVVLTRNLLREQEELDTRVEALDTSLQETDAAITQARQTLSRDVSALKNEQTTFLTRMFRRKSFSWTGLFNELEAITPANVRVTAIAPEEENGRIGVTMTVVGRRLADVLEMVRQLEDSSLFATVYPVDEASLDVSRGGEPGIAATLQLDYIEPSKRGEPTDEDEDEDELEAGPEPSEGEGDDEPLVPEAKTKTETETETETETPTPGPPPFAGAERHR